jgi:hypothetical protein
VLLGAAAGGATTAAAVFSGASLGSLDTATLALVTAALCAATWLYERRRSRSELVRGIDGRLASAGAFATAVECEERGAGPLDAALVARVAARVGPREVRGTISPPSIAFVAAPVFAAALVLMALEHAPDRSRFAAQPALRALAAELGAQAEGASSTDPVLELAAEAQRLASEAAAPGEVPERLRRLHEEVEALAGESPGLDRAEELADAALEALTGDPRPDRSPLPERASAAGSARSDGASAHLAQSAAGSTMGGSPSRTQGAGDGSLSSVGPADTTGSVEREAGVIAGRWWDERYDEIVTAWIETGGERRE